MRSFIDLEPPLQVGNGLAAQVYGSADPAHGADMIAEPAPLRWEAAPRGTHAETVAPSSVSATMPPLRLIVITYHWPPFAGSGAGRWTALVKYLRRLGHDVTVVTTSAFGALPSDAEDAVVRTRDLASAQALRKLMRRPPLEADGDAAVEKAPSPLLTRVAVPDSYLMSWVPFAVGAARRILRERGADCVITSSPPDSVHLAGLALGRDRPTWVADLRDGWLFEPLREPFPTRPQRALDARLEGRVARRADAMTAATRPIAQDLERRLGAAASVVPNAWDPDLEVAVAAAEAPELRPGAFSFVHTGTLSGGWGRDPRPLARAFASLLTERPQLRERVRIVLAGRRREDGLSLFSEFGLTTSSITSALFPTRRDGAAARARALLLVTSPNSGEATGKLFEYLASGRPIVALAAGNEAARIVDETGAGIAVSPQDPRGSARRHCVTPSTVSSRPATRPTGSSATPTRAPPRSSRR